MVKTASAQLALDIYASRTGSCSGGDRNHPDYGTDLVDLIADLLHLADGLGVEYGYRGSGGLAALESASAHYLAESRGE